MQVMRVFEVHYPGTWLDGTPSRDQVDPLLHQLCSQLADASIGLTLFEEAVSRPKSEPGRIRRREAARIIAQAMENQFTGNLPPSERMATLQGISEAADLQARRQEWAAGRVPDAYQHRLPFIHAHTVVYALDSIGKTLDTLAGISGLPAAVTAARDGYRAALPDLVHVRDSAHHVEDRARGLDRRGRPLVLQPVDNQMFKAPNGMLGLSNLNGNKLGYTTSDGHYRETEISANSVHAAQAAIQQTLDAFSWRGPTRTVPS